MIHGLSSYYLLCQARARRRLCPSRPFPDGSGDKQILGIKDPRTRGISRWPLSGSECAHRRKAQLAWKHAQWKLELWTWYETAFSRCATTPWLTGPAMADSPGAPGGVLQRFPSYVVILPPAKASPDLPSKGTTGITEFRQVRARAHYPHTSIGIGRTPDTYAFVKVRRCNATLTAFHCAEVDTPDLSRRGRI